jgi:uncharacterized membrane protein
LNVQGNHRLELAMGQMLRVGVSSSALVVLAGGILYLQQSHSSIASYQTFNGAPTAYETVGGILAGLGRFDAQSLICLGILLLIATPICRVIFGMIGFSLLRDRFYAIVSAIVLIILLFSFSAGR